MSEEDVNNYRLTSAEEPTDEMLSYIMHEVAEEARISNEEAHKRYFAEIKEMCKREYGANKRERLIIDELKRN